MSTETLPASFYDRARAANTDTARAAIRAELLPALPDENDPARTEPRAASIEALMDEIDTDTSLCAQTDPESFFPEKGGSTKDPKSLCNGGLVDAAAATARRSRRTASIRALSTSLTYTKIETSIGGETVADDGREFGTVVRVGTGKPARWTYRPEPGQPRPMGVWRTRDEAALNLLATTDPYIRGRLAALAAAAAIDDETGPCPLRDACLKLALLTDERFGIWGGMSERERRPLARALRDTNDPDEAAADELPEITDDDTLREVA